MYGRNHAENNSLENCVVETKTMYYRETLQLDLLVLESKELGALKMQVCKNTGSKARKLGKITHSKCF